MSDSNYLYQSMSLFPSAQSVASSHSLLTSSSCSSLPFHNILSVPFIALDIKHFLTPFTVTSG